MTSIDSVRKVELMLKNTTMRVGSKQKVHAVIEPALMDDEKLAWFTSDREIATVDENGTVHARANGKIAVVAEIPDGSGIYGVAWIRVADPTYQPEEYRITLDASNGKGDLLTQIALEDLPVTIPECSFTPPAGTKFAFWDMEGLSLYEGDSFTFIQDTRIRAVWEAI